jgi:uncharacterized protein involved in exopolysaccharide biosynthesis
MNDKRVARQLRNYREHLERDRARELAEQRLAELEAQLAQARERRGMAPIKSDTGAILGWVDTRPQVPGGR